MSCGHSGVHLYILQSGDEGCNKCDSKQPVVDFINYLKKLKTDEERVVVYTKCFDNFCQYCGEDISSKRNCHCLPYYNE